MIFVESWGIQGVHTLGTLVHFDLGAKTPWSHRNLCVVVFVCSMEVESGFSFISAQIIWLFDKDSAQLIGQQ